MAKIKGALDLATLDTATPCDEGAEIEIKHPLTGEGVGVFITVFGRDSDVFREFNRTRINARLRQEQIDSRRGKQAAIKTMDDVERENVELLSACTKSWRSLETEGAYGDYITVDGNKLPFSIPNAQKLYNDPRFRFIYDQVNEAIADLGNFIKV